jgi:enoyl-CoA hydratase
MVKATDFSFVEDQILRELREGILILTLNRPGSYNAWTMAQRAQLEKIFRDAEADNSVGAIVVTGWGDNAFCAGQELAELEHLGDGKAMGNLLVRLFECYDAIREFTKPLVAALNGVAAGSGFQLAQFCDFVVAHPEVRMGQPEVNSGLPSVFGTWLMSERVGSRAYELSLQGRMILAFEGFQLGFVNEIVPRESVLDAAMVVAQRLSEQPRDAYRHSKIANRRLNQPRYEVARGMALEAYEESFDAATPQQEISQFFNREKKVTA